MFDLKREMVIKVFDSDVDKNSIKGEVGRLKGVAGISFAPAIGKLDIDGRWYEEEYVSESPLAFYKTMKPAELLSAFHNITPCLYGLMNFEKPLLIDAADYATDILNMLKKATASNGLFDGPGINRIRSFIGSIEKIIPERGDTDIYLVFSHGDFCAANILNTARGIRVIDWEGAGHRSALFDFYSYFFYLPVCINHSLAGTVSAVNDALEEYVSGSSLENPDIYKSMSANSRLYRCLFYLEFISKLVEREDTDKNLDIKDFIFRYIESFNLYEEMLSDLRDSKDRGSDSSSKSSACLTT